MTTTGQASTSELFHVLNDQSLHELDSNVRAFLAEMQYQPLITQCDHLGYIVKSDERYEEVRRYFETNEKIVRELVPDVSMNFTGKKFLIAKLGAPLLCAGFETDIIEVKLSDFASFNDGFQHAEFLINEDLHKVVDENSEIQFETPRIDDPDNAEIGAFKKRTSMSVKFRNKPLIR